MLQRVKTYCDRYGLAAVLLAFVLATFGFYLGESFDNQSMDYLRIAGWGVRQILFGNFGDQVPLWFLLAKAYTSIFGTSEVVLRFFPFLFVLLSAVVLHRLAGRYGAPPLLVVSLFLLNPLVLDDTAYVFKHWSFLTFLCLLALWFFEEYRRTGAKKYMVFMACAAVAGMYANLVFLVFLAALSVSFLAEALAAPKRVSLRHFAAWCMALTLAAVPLLFQLGLARTQLMDVQGAHMEWAVSPGGWDFLKKSFGALTGIRSLGDFPGLPALFLAILAALVVLQVIRRGGRSADERRRLLWLASTVAFVFIVLMAAAPYTPMQYRYLSFTAPFLYLALFHGLRTKAGLVLGTVLLFLTVFSAVRLAAATVPEDWRGIAEFLRPQIGADSRVVLLFDNSAGAFTLEYYTGHPVRHLTQPDDATLLDALTGEDIWLVVVHGAYDAAYALAGQYDIAESGRFDPVKILHFASIPPGSRTAHLIFGEPRIGIARDGRSEEVRFADGRMTGPDCCDEEWQRIRLRKMTAGGEDRVCLFAHPREGGEIRIAFRDVALKERLTFVTGIDDGMVRGNLSPVIADVRVNGSSVGRVIHPDIRGWLASAVDTAAFAGVPAEVEVVVSADNDEKRHFCFDAVAEDGRAPDDWFYRNLPSASAGGDGGACRLYRTEATWPHNERKPPYADSKIFERWDCGKNLAEEEKIWNTVGRSYAIGGGEFRQAIWMHPTDDGKRTLKFAGMKKSPQAVTGYYGVSDHAAGKIGDVTITFSVGMNGETVFEDAFVPAEGWKRFEVPVRGEIRDMLFSVASTKNRWNHFFFNAFLQE